MEDPKVWETNIIIFYNYSKILINISIGSCYCKEVQQNTSSNFDSLSNSTWSCCDSKVGDQKPYCKQLQCFWLWIERWRHCWNQQLRMQWTYLPDEWVRFWIFKYFLVFILIYICTVKKTTIWEGELLMEKSIFYHLTMTYFLSIIHCIWTELTKISNISYNESSTKLGNWTLQLILIIRSTLNFNSTGATNLYLYQKIMD